jgi:hypothetical protein
MASKRHKPVSPGKRPTADQRRAWAELCTLSRGQYRGSAVSAPGVLDPFPKQGRGTSCRTGQRARGGGFEGERSCWQAGRLPYYPVNSRVPRGRNYGACPRKRWGRTVSSLRPGLEDGSSDRRDDGPEADIPRRRASGLPDLAALSARQTGLKGWQAHQPAFEPVIQQHQSRSSSSSKVRLFGSV